MDKRTGPTRPGGRPTGGGSQYRILGPLEVNGPRGHLPVLAPRQQVVLAMLLLEANRVVPVERLIKALWGDSPPATAKGQVHICVSAVRRSLAEAGLLDAIATRPPGYTLIVADAQLDLHMFEQRVAAGRTAVAGGALPQAVDRFGAALSLWRGDPLGGVQSDLVASVAARMVERYLCVVEELSDARLRLGDHQRLVEELTDLVDEHPLRERLRALLMLALVGAGRRVEALDCYQEARQTLVDELGLEPGEELQRLQRTILMKDSLAGSDELVGPTAGPDDERPTKTAAPVTVAPADTTVPVPHQLPAAVGDFTGRDKVLAQARDVLATARENGCGTCVVVLSGGAGAGKTALAIQVAHDVEDAFPDGQLYAMLGPATNRTAHSAEILDQFLRALGVLSPAIPAGLEERAAVFRSRIAGRRVLVVLDDAADEDHVRPLLPGGRHCAVIVTSRHRLTALPAAQHLEVGMLDVDTAIELLDTALGRERTQAEPVAVRRLAELCDGWPLALRIVAARLAARPHWPIARLAERMEVDSGRLNELVHGHIDVRTVIAATYEQLAPPARRLLRLLGALDLPDYPAWTAGPLLAQQGIEPEELLDDLAGSRLLDINRIPGQSVRFRLPGLVRAFARERLAAEESPADGRDAVLRVLAAWLFLTEEAHRRESGSDQLPVLSDAPRWALPVGTVDRLLADPLRWFETERPVLMEMVRHAADVGADDLCWSLALAAAGFFKEHSDLDRWRQTHAVAVAAARRAGNARGEAALEQTLQTMNLFERRLADATGRLTSVAQLLDELGEARGRPVVIRNLALLRRIRGPLYEAIERYERSVRSLSAAQPPRLPMA